MGPVLYTGRALCQQKAQRCCQHLAYEQILKQPMFSREQLYDLSTVTQN